MESEYHQHQNSIHITTPQHHVTDHSILDQITDHHHLYDSYVPCGYNNNHHQVFYKIRFRFKLNFSFNQIN